MAHMSPKRPSAITTSYFDGDLKEVEWSEIESILSSVSADDTEPGWISARVFMVFPMRRKSSAQLICPKTKRQLKIFLTCADFSQFQFAIEQHIKLSLRAARIVKSKAGTSASAYMPFSLEFKEGAAIKFVKGGKTMEDDEFVNSWHVKEDWFASSPVVEPHNDSRNGSQRAGSHSSPATPLPETPGRDEENDIPEASISISNETTQEESAMDVDTIELAQDTIVYCDKVPVDEHESNQEPAQKPGIQIKRIRKKETRHDHSRKVVITQSQTSEASSKSSEPGRRTNQFKREKKKRQRDSERVTETAPPLSPPKRNPVLDLVAGASTEGGVYPSLDSIKENTFVNVIGVVISAEEPQNTRKGDFKTTLVLTDPSTFGSGRGFTVTLFMKPGFEHLLPPVSLGHVLLLRCVKTTKWNNNINGTVYADRLMWAGLNPATGKMYYPDKVAPQHLSAFYDVKNLEVDYCVKLSQWWQAVKEEAERGAVEIEYVARKVREHRLIGECDVGKFFNATVEILKVTPIQSEQTMLVFTDYTAHPQRSLNGFYGQYAMHGSTGNLNPELLDSIKEGTYWLMDNIRLKLRDGNLEVDFYNSKLNEVYVADDAADLHLEALLIRKEVYLKEHSHELCEGKPSGLTQSLISDISGRGHYNIVAELLYRSVIDSGRANIFVTDYTKNPSLSTFKPSGLLRELKGLPVPVFQISIWDGNDMVRSLEMGAVYTFADIRVAEYNNEFVGNLKFADRRITQNSVKKTDNPAVITLLKEKKEFYERHSATEPSETQSNIRPAKATHKNKAVISFSNAIKSRHMDQNLSTIEEIKTIQKCPNKYRLRARIVEYFPLNINDFTCQMCKKCKQKIPDNRYACIMCEDMMGEHVEWMFYFFFVLEDEHGEKIIVDAHTESKYFLFGIAPCDLKEDANTLQAIKRRLRGCLGNLEERHEGLKRGELIKAEYAPFFDLAIKSWVHEGELVFSLTGCEALDPHDS